MLSDDDVFSVEGDLYCWRDVILSAVRSGAWRDVERRARQGAACSHHAEATRGVLPSTAVDAASREFRYAHDLVTAHSMEEWLARRGLTAQEWTGYLRRDLYQRQWAAQPEDLAARYPIPDDEAATLAFVDAKCSFALETWARALAARAAAHTAVMSTSYKNGGTATAPSADTEPESLPPALPVRALGTDDSARLSAAAGRLRKVEASVAAFRTSVVTEPALRSYVSARQLDWVRFGCRIMSFPDEGMAAEAALLLREDGEGFTAVYQVAHTVPKGAHFFLDDVDDTLRDFFLGSRVGDVIGPVRRDGAYVLYQVDEKVLPVVGDPHVRCRAEAGVLAAALEQQCDRRVTWLGAEVRR